MMNIPVQSEQHALRKCMHARKVVACQHALAAGWWLVLRFFIPERLYQPGSKALPSFTYLAACAVAAAASIGQASLGGR